MVNIDNVKKITENNEKGHVHTLYCVSLCVWRDVNLLFTRRENGSVETPILYFVQYKIGGPLHITYLSASTIIYSTVSN